MAGKKFELTEYTLSIIEEIGGHMPGGFFIYKAREPQELIYANKAVLDIFGCSDMDEFKALTGGTFRGWPSQRRWWSLWAEPSASGVRWAKGPSLP